MRHKVLYLDNGKPDYYTDETFLDELKKNINVRTYHFWPVVKASGTVSQQLSSCLIFVAAFLLMQQHDDVTTAYIVLFVIGSTTLLGYLLVVSFLDSKDIKVVEAFKCLMVYIVTGFGLSPVLHTLTQTISSDTINFMITAMLLTNLLFFDYGTSTSPMAQSVSFSAAIFAAVCMASRLPTVTHSFTLIALAVQTFVLLPVLRTRLKTAHPWLQVPMTVIFYLLAVTGLAFVSLVGALLFTCITLFITFACPALLINMQPYKNNINGPWDEAVISE